LPVGAAPPRVPQGQQEDRIAAGFDHSDEFDGTGPNQPDRSARHKGRQFFHQLHEARAGHHRPAGKMALQDPVRGMNADPCCREPVARQPFLYDKEIIQ